MTETNLDRNLAGYCGIYCGACDIYCLHARGKETHCEPTWTDLPEVFQKHLPFGPLPVKCEGCRSDNVFGGCAHCWMRACAKKHNILNSCVECKRYPCFRYGLFSLMAWFASFEKKFPHIKNRKANRERLVQLRIDPWLKRQDEHWRCPECRTRFSWYAQSCSKCGKDLSALDRFAML